jgi:hypothetical protein
VEEILLSALNVQGTSGNRQIGMHTAEPFVPQPSASEVQFATGKLKTCQSKGADKIPAELIQAGGGTLHFEIYKLNS